MVNPKVVKVEEEQVQVLRKVIVSKAVVVVVYSQDNE